MSVEEQRAEVVRYWWSMAEDSLASAQREFDASAFVFAVNRLYYAVFYAASSALLERQQTFRKHSGVRAGFHRTFIKTGLLGVEWGKFYDQLFGDRQEGDYIALVDFDSVYVASQLARCTQFMDAFRPLISSLR